MTIQEILTAHTVKRPWSEANRMKCKCGQAAIAETETQLYALHRAHVAEVLDKHMQEREVALLSSVAEEAIEKYAGKPYSPGHVNRLLLTRANQIRKEQS